MNVFYEDCESSNFGVNEVYEDCDNMFYEDRESCSFGDLLGFEANNMESSFGDLLGFEANNMAHVVNDNAVFGPHGSNLSSPSCEYKYVLSADEAKHENIQDKQDSDMCVSRNDENLELPFSNTNICDFIMCTDICFICNSRPRQLKVPQVVPPYGRSEGESEIEELSLSEPGVRRAVCISPSLALSHSHALAVLPVWGPAHSGMLHHTHGMYYDDGHRVVNRSQLATSRDYTVYNVYFNGQPNTLFETDGSMTARVGSRPYAVHFDVMHGSCL